MTAAALLVELSAEGVVITARDGRLAYDGPAGAMTPGRLEELTTHKLELLALLTRRPMPSGVPGIVCDPRGGVRVERPPELRLVAYDLARARGFPALCLTDTCAEVAAGAEAWRAFTDAAAIGAIAEALLLLDDVPVGAPG